MTGGDGTRGEADDTRAASDYVPGACHLKQLRPGFALLCLLTVSAAGCDDQPEECYGNHDCTQPGQVCDVVSNTCVDAPDALLDALPDAMPASDGCAPAAERCNGADDDCDGIADEGFAIGAACEVGVGACLVAGLTICSADGLATVCDARAGPPEDERCNTLDDDCDGQTDEGFLVGEGCMLGDGLCAVTAAYVCAEDGAGVICPIEPGVPDAEQCDGFDNDCDGAVDEDAPYPCGPLRLSSGRATWAAGTSQSADGRYVLTGRGASLSPLALTGRAGPQEYRLVGRLVGVGGR
ncbi:MAG: hypothetical protein KC620_10125 [Myxococcales bacterium]|nr:hypothetical protein [Myxococcales bacterium]